MLISRGQVDHRLFNTVLNCWTVGLNVQVNYCTQHTTFARSVTNLTNHIEYTGKKDNHYRSSTLQYIQFITLITMNTHNVIQLISVALSFILHFIDISPFQMYVDMLALVLNSICLECCRKLQYIQIRSKGMYDNRPILFNYMYMLQRVHTVTPCNALRNVIGLIESGLNTLLSASNTLNKSSTT
ncbi:Uncharacterised protein [Paenibacillus polymyxa]|uniref:Uncharacterized protein n=1 Tax=Paenibacillus polymyxa TaxID=1406 RepID=A0A378XUQ9_PAEPO|nr:Uncharacterised protein [Paenibacillus polymyxa]